MGLDQYGYAVMPHKDNNDFEYAWQDNANPEAVVLIAQWRKHADLQGYMENLFYEKKEQAGEPVEYGWEGFNCQPLRLTLQDLVNLEEAVKQKDLPLTTGFFFGQSCEEDMEDDLAFIEEAKNAMASDMEIYYSSWW